jgi:hypothetical protein
LEFHGNGVPPQDACSPKALFASCSARAALSIRTFGRMNRFVEIDHQPFLVLRKQAEAPRRVLKFADFARNIRVFDQFADSRDIALP